MAAAPLRQGWRAALLAAAISLALIVVSAVVSDTAVAASRACRQLEAELSSGGGGAGSSGQVRRQDEAIARQSEVLQRAKRQARGAGCGFKLFGGGATSCGAINEKIDRMERNLDSLRRKRAQLAGGGSGRSRAEINAALRSNGCRDEQVAERRAPRDADETRTLFQQLFGGGIRRRDSSEELGEPGRVREEDRNLRRVPQEREGGWVNDGGRIHFSAPPGRYRTLCVRTCDGYFFPMSSSSTPQDFERDQANCQTSCPGATTEIYYTRPGEESESMVSGVSGEPYAYLSTAYLYNQTGVPSPAGCTCSAQRTDPSANFSVIAGNPPAPIVEPEPSLPYPTARPDPAADPETLANINGRLDAEALKRMAVTPKVNTTKTPADERKVRVVGPVFLPDPEAEADPLAPAPTQVR
ncbi:MAG: DUF2865 domain-containing protein [Hyphomicrobiales bacterium]|nr:DUF2865 domain-containing protein [Hyphomicrobiales bacterium]